uniref:Uncharacterized protein n=1 Tax=Setaria viridis TaxID=4556 RepID=A0A4U6VQ08_SETVI|nr:hypothetical protein SEVIR_2G091800v2 [Setaria viridis]
MAAPSAPLLVVGLQFCAPHVLLLTLAMKYNGRCTVDDANGAAVLRMEEVSFFSFRRHYVLVDAAGVPVISLKAKARHVYIRWSVFRGDSHDAGDLLFTATASSGGRWPFRGLDVFLAGNTRRGAADFRTKGDFRRSGYFYLGNSDKMIASISYHQHKSANI